LRIDSHVCLSASHPPEHLQAILARNRFEGALLVVDQLPFPETGPHIAGMVHRGVESLDECAKDARFRGVCAPLADVTPAVAEELARRGFTLDVAMRPGDFPALASLAESVPALRIVIDHLARPAFAQGMTDEWAGGMEAAARLTNVVCKLSGLLTEVPLPWKAEPIRPFVQHALAVFGPRRAMFGSEWPVRLPDVTWKESLAAFTQSIGAHTMETREQLLGGTAAEFYRLG
jgi:predicted TIM-barrel fold metal-dependent hydrolase